MEEQTKYLVHVQCQPMPLGQESQLTKELARSFPVERCWTDRDWLTIELVSGHRLANGTLKDLADSIQQCLSSRGVPVEIRHRSSNGAGAGGCGRPVGNIRPGEAVGGEAIANRIAGSFGDANIQPGAPGPRNVLSLGHNP